MTGGSLIFQSGDHRLISAGRHTAGFEDYYIIEHRETDSLGGDRWVVLRQWQKKFDNEGCADALVDLLKAALRRASALTPETPL